MPAVLLFIGLASLFGLSYYLNAKTPVPEGCEKLMEDCNGCQIVSCAHRRKVEESL